MGFGKDPPHCVTILQGPSSPLPTSFETFEMQYCSLIFLPVRRPCQLAFSLPFSFVERVIYGFRDLLPQRALRLLRPCRGSFRGRFFPVPPQGRCVPVAFRPPVWFFPGRGPSRSLFGPSVFTVSAPPAGFPHATHFQVFQLKQVF